MRGNIRKETVLAPDPWTSDVGCWIISKRCLQVHASDGGRQHADGMSACRRCVERGTSETTGSLAKMGSHPEGMPAAWCVQSRYPSSIPIPDFVRKTIMKKINAASIVEETWAS